MAKYIVEHRRATRIKLMNNDDLIPFAGEITIESDEENHLHRLKMEDGVHTYKDLAYSERRINMALFKPMMGSRTALDSQTKQAGYAWFCTDDGTFHIDYVDAEEKLQRKQINEIFIKQLLNITNDVGYLDTGRIIEYQGGEANGK